MTEKALKFEFSIKDFNPHSREGSDVDEMDMEEKEKSISIHTPAKGVTVIQRQCFQMILYFNPHSREGSDAE